MKHFVYILASRNKTLYTGMTNDLRRRLGEHRRKTRGFTSRYNITQLVYFEECDSRSSAWRREREIKAWRREKRVDLVASMNPKWEDLAKGW